MKDLFSFCEWLSYRKHCENDYAANMTLQGILHFVSLSATLALKDNDYEEYKEWTELRRKISHQEDVVRVSSRS